MGSYQYTSHTIAASNDAATPTSAGRFACDKLITAIMPDDTISLDNIKTAPSGNQIVPSNILDNKGNVPYFYPGTTGSYNSASTVYSELVRITKWLLKVGTWSYYEYKQQSGSSYSGRPKANEYTASGLALFSDAYSLSDVNSRGYSFPVLNGTPGNGGVVTAKTMSVDSLNAFIQNCITIWTNSNRPQYSTEYSYCHNSCHSSCHSSCHDDCYGDGGHTDLRPWVCHANSVAYNNEHHVHPDNA
jgi:hypothetical protein